MKTRCLSLLSAGLGAALGIYYERTRRLFNEPVQSSDFDRGTRFPWPVVSAKAIVPTSNVPVSTGSTSRSGEIMKYGFPGMDNIRTFEDYVVSYDRRNRIPHWVFEHLTHDQAALGEDVSREGSTFYEDQSIHQYFRATNEDYKKSGYDRGHLAAAANHRWSQRALDQTFVLSNVSPQVGKGFNRDAWNTLEKFVRSLTKHYKNVYVCSGPLYLPRREGDNKLYVKYEVIGKNHVAVPTHFFKVVLCETATNELELLSFVMPNQVLPDKIDLKHYLLPLETVERASGLLLYSGIPKEKLKKVNGKSI